MCRVPCIDRVEKNVQRFYYISTIFLKNTTIRRRIEKIKNRSKSMDGALPRYFFLCQKYPCYANCPSSQRSLVKHDLSSINIF